MKTRPRFKKSNLLPPKMREQIAIEAAEKSNLILTICVLHDVFGFGKKRINRFVDSYKEVADSFQAGDKNLDEINEEVLKLANNSEVDGIIVQLPLPKKFNTANVLRHIPAEKDVDGLCTENLGKLVAGEKTIVSCTPYGIIKLLEEYGIEFEGKNAVVIGRSNMVGKPVAALLLQRNCTVTNCHSRTADIKKFSKEADILVVAIGKANFVTADMVKEGAVVVDVGINRVDGKLYGDVEFEGVSKIASYITPVPGGVGPMTVTMLMYNTVLAAFRSKNADDFQ